MFFLTILTRLPGAASSSYHISSSVLIIDPRITAELFPLSHLTIDPRCTAQLFPSSDSTTDSRSTARLCPVGD